MSTSWARVIAVGVALAAVTALATARGADPHPSPTGSASKAASQTALSLPDLEQMALRCNPTLAQAAAAIGASRGKALQAGLYPNPTVGYRGENIGIEGSAGEFQGGFVQQTIVTAGKLRLSRAKYNQEAYEAELLALTQQYRVLNGVRLRYWELLALERTAELHRNLVTNAQEALRTTREMFNTGQASRSDVLLMQTRVNDAKIGMLTWQNQYPALWQCLAALVGSADLPTQPLAGQLDQAGPPLDWNSALSRLLTESPELQAAQAHVARDQIAVQRERVEPIPNIQLEGASGYSFETRNAVATAQVGIALPIFNRNQGTIHEAEADLVRSRSEVARVELSLRQRLAEAFNRYRTALETAQLYREGNIPQAEEAYQTQLDMYRKRREPWREVVMLQRNLLEQQERYTHSLLELRKAEVEIVGLLLVDGLTTPPTPASGGHLEANPDPR
ncbi:MAG TPA: TolC family protein [Planctomycetaceae bacterium]|jgi:cobalt-zinc-cadmium efflux system outer membrane protein|nr:TolC family protein [Planctomycetaceae bacterium]